MSGTLTFKQKSHLNPTLVGGEPRTLNVDKLTGHWVNTNKDSQLMTDFEIRQEDDGKFMVRASGVGEDGPIEWPTMEADVLANLEEEEGQKAVVFAVLFDLGYMEMLTQIRVNKGILVVVMFNRFKDESGRSNYVTREFFKLAE